jgi:predicted metalloprotease with PDZ domain
MPRPHTHLFEVEISVEPSGREALEFVLPSWTPGSYMIREYARHVQAFAAHADGTPAAWTKSAKDAWRVETGGAQRVVVRYRVHAFDLTVRTCHLDGTHGFFTPAALLMFVDGRTAEPVQLSIDAPRGWRVATGLPRRGRAWVAGDYDELVDAPVECGTHRTLFFEIDGKPHEIALWGSGNEDDAALVRDAAAIVGAQRDFFGGLPYDRYVFIVHLANGRGGLEHRNSCVLLCDRFTFRPQAAYEHFLALLSHEFFHVWNVKRVRPAPLGPFDYRRENYTRQLWTMEGVTTYYEKRFLVAARLLSAARWLELLADDIAALAAQPGRALQSLEESSFDAWIKLYRPDENSANSGISYYLKGGIVALALDLEIRHVTEGAGSLDDVMRALHSAHPPEAPGFAESDGFLAAVERVAGSHRGTFRRFFERWVAGREELDLDGAFARAGLRLEWSRRSRNGDAPAWLGTKLKREGDRTTVAACRSDGPAWSAGIYAGDELLARHDTCRCARPEGDDVAKLGQGLDGQRVTRRRARC